jgi:hypothetical protein
MYRIMPGLEYQALLLYATSILRDEYAGKGRSNSTSTHIYQLLNRGEQHMKFQVFWDVMQCRLLNSNISKKPGVFI